ncbi:MAG: cyclic nucleotide-binding domain-containing protein [Actinomycetota bacterium]|nr:cyclic nucleotide-binding domain-containing protein [Actinomycetota bacterium]
MTEPAPYGRRFARGPDRGASGLGRGPLGAVWRLRSVLRTVGSNGSLSRLLLAFLTMTLAEYGEWIALLIYAYGRGGASTAGLVAFAQLVPSIVLAPIISARASRIGVARLLGACYAASTLMLACCGAAILLHAPALVVYAAAICFTVPIGVSVPMHNVLMPLVVRHPDELTAANVATGWCKGVGSLAGPALAGLLIGLQGPGLACGALAGACLFTPLLARVHPLRAAAHGGEEEPPGKLADLIAAARVIASRPNTRALMGYRAGAAAVEGAMDLLAVLIAVRILMIGPAAAGYLNATFGAGGVIGASAAVLLVGRHLAVPLAATALLCGAAVAALTLATTTPVAVLLLLIVGASRSAQSAASQTLLQRSTPLEVIVCAFALIESMRDAGLAFGSLVVPLLVSLGSTDAAFLGVASIALLAVIVTLPRIRRIDRDASIPVVEMGLLRNLGIFSALPAAPLETLARQASYVSFAPGATVVREGQEGDRYYAIADGQVLVTKGRVEVRRMGRGDGFGEIALLHTDRRTATVTAISPTTLLCIERDCFLAALNASTHVRESARRLAKRLLAQTP